MLPSLSGFPREEDATSASQRHFGGVVAEGLKLFPEIVVDRFSQEASIIMQRSIFVILLLPCHSHLHIVF